MNRPAHYSNGDRMSKAAYIAAQCPEQLRGSVLDVGCAQAYLRKFCGRYVGIDFDPREADICWDLEKPLHVEAIHGAHGHFETVVCTDVLEHVDRAFELIAELQQLAGRWVIISLPNVQILGNRLRWLLGADLGKEHRWRIGDRHKWLTNVPLGREFVHSRLEPGWRVAREWCYYPGTWWRRGALYRWASRRWPNAFALAYWALLEREQS